jgi:hypothetical protein
MSTSLRTRFPAAWVVISLAAGLSAFSQAASRSWTQSGASPVSAPVSAIVQPALTEVQSSLSALNISRWKAPSEVKSAAQQNTTSIERDLTNILPGLLSQADAASGAVPAEFAAYRNIDALYDVLLRVYETASLSAPQSESDALFSALQRLETARTQLGDAILNASQQREEQLVKLQAAVRAATAASAQPTPAKSTVVDDGPAASPTVRKKKKPAPKPPANSSGTAQTPSGSGHS